MNRRDDYEITVKDSEKNDHWCNACARHDPDERFITISYGYGNSRTIVRLCIECAIELATKLDSI